MRSSAESRRATTAAASSRSAIESPEIPGSGSIISSVSWSAAARRASRAASSSSTHGVALERAEGDERAGRAPAVPRLRLGLERPAQRAHHDRVLLAHAHQHQVARELEGEVLEEEREVEALVELDRDEDHLERERPLVRREDRADVLLRARARGLALLEEAPPRLGVGGRVVDERVEQRLAQRLGGVEPEQQLGRLAPLRHRALAVGQDEEPVDQLREECVERVVRDFRLVDVRVLRGVCWMGFMRGSATQPLLQEHGCRTGVLGHHPPGSACQLRGEAFVVDLNRHIEPITQPLDERTGLACLIRVASRQRERQPDQHVAGWSSSIRAISRPKPLRVPGCSSGSSGVTSVRVGSETATPQRALP